MKKLISILAALAVVTTCSVVGFAADFEVPADLETVTKYEKVAEGEDAGLYVVDLATVAGDQDQTTILAVKGEEINVGSIEYIGQSADTTFKFDLRNTLAAGETVYVLAGGSDITAQVVGYMAEEATEPELPPVETFTISGTVSGYMGTTLPTVTLYNGETVVENAEITVEAGATAGTANFTVVVDALEEGSYTLKATKTAHLKYAKANLSANTADVAAIVKAGDLNDDDNADITDIGLLVNNYLVSADDGTNRYTANYDPNEDEAIDITDIGIVVNNYLAESISE